LHITHDGTSAAEWERGTLNGKERHCNFWLLAGKTRRPNGVKSRFSSRRRTCRVQDGQLRRQIEATDRRTDQLVYALYGLTDAEIKIVEDATRG
jgi:hypothetical protein